MNRQHPARPFPRTAVAVHLAKLGMDHGLCAASVPHADRMRAPAVSSRLRRAEFLAGRLYLRCLLASRLGRRLAEIAIVEGLDGKPRLANGEIEFSLSHHYPWYAVALSEECPVGVDVEPIREFAGMNEVVAEFFPPPARDAYLAAAPAERPATFFRWWARIEAAVKATGCGLDHSSSCLERVVYRSCEAVPGIALAVAARSRGPLVVDWRLSVTRPGRFGDALNSTAARLRGDRPARTTAR